VALPVSFLDGIDPFFWLANAFGIAKKSFCGGRNFYKVVRLGEIFRKECLTPLGLFSFLQSNIMLPL